MCYKADEEEEKKSSLSSFQVKTSDLDNASKQGVIKIKLIKLVGVRGTLLNRLNFKKCICHVLSFWSVGVGTGHCETCYHNGMVTVPLESARDLQNLLITSAELHLQHLLENTTQCSHDTFSFVCWC